MKPYTVVTLPAPSFNKQIKVAILGIGNHRVPNYELPSNIPGLTFTDPIATAQQYAPGLAAANDAVVALTHIGFTSNPSSVEVDTKVDTNLAAQTTGIDAIIGGHSHTDPSKQTAASGDYLYLPAYVGNPNGDAGARQPGLPLQQLPGRDGPGPAARRRRRLESGVDALAAMRRSS